MSKRNIIGQLILEQEQVEVVAPMLDLADVPDEELGEFCDTFEGSSLNIGVELDYEFSLANEYEPKEGEILDVSELQQEVVSLESRIQDLMYLHADVSKARGMSQRFALEAQKLLPDSFKEPVSYYTQEPSITRYKVSLEKLSGGMIALIAAAIAAVILAIAKIYKWATGKSNGESSATEAHEVLQEEAKIADKVPEVLAKAAKVVHKADGLLKNAKITLKNADGREYKVTSMQEIIDNFMNDSERYDRAKQLLKLKDPVLRDIINGGPYSRKMIALSQRIQLIKNVILSELTMLDGVVKRDLNSRQEADRLVSLNLLKRLNEPLTIKVDDQEGNLNDIASGVTRLRQELKEQDLREQPIMFDHIYTAMSNAYKRQNIGMLLVEVSQVMISMGEVEKRLKRLDEVSRDISTDGSPGALSQDIGVELRRMILKISKDVAGFGHLVSEIKYFSSNLQHLANLVVGFGKEVITKTVREMRKNNQEVPAAWQELMKELTLEKKAIERAYFSF